MQPTDLALELNNKADELDLLLPNYDTDFVVTSSEWDIYYPNFWVTPENVTWGENDMEFVVQLDNYGRVYAVAVELEYDTGIPTAQQIYYGTDNTNWAVPIGFVEVSE